jgi:hypothetical protein
MDEVRFCWSLRGKSDAETQKALQERFKAKEHAKFKQRPSREIWEVWLPLLPLFSGLWMRY